MGACNALGGTYLELRTDIICSGGDYISPFGGGGRCIANRLADAESGFYFCSWVSLSLAMGAPGWMAIAGDTGCIIDPVLDHCGEVISGAIDHPGGDWCSRSAIFGQRLCGSLIYARNTVCDTVFSEGELRFDGSDLGEGNLVAVEGQLKGIKLAGEGWCFPSELVLGAII